MTQVALIKSIAEEFGSALKQETLRLKAEVRDSLAELMQKQDEQSETFNERFKRLSDLEDKLDLFVKEISSEFSEIAKHANNLSEQKLQELEQQVSDRYNKLTDQYSKLSETVEGLPVPLDPEQFIDVITGKLNIKEAIDRQLNAYQLSQFEEREAAEKQIAERLIELKSEFRSEFENFSAISMSALASESIRLKHECTESIGNVRAEIQEQLDALKDDAEKERQYEVNIEQLTKTLEASEHFHEQMNVHINAAIDHFWDAQQKRLTAATIKHYDHAMEAVTKLVETFLNDIELPRDGKDGLDGKDGKNGIDGKDGIDGIHGKDGKDGIDGKDGLDGANGKDGIDGVHGKDGKDGIDGKDGLDGKDGEKGDTGSDGADGLGFNVKRWKSGEVYREGTVVTAHIGQCFKAVKDTVAKPGDSDDWKRMSDAGFRWRGLKPDQETLKEGDFFIDSGSLFMQLNGKARMIVQRGKNGKDGVDGRDGKDGKPAPDLVDIKSAGTELMFAFENGDVLSVELPQLKTLKEERDYIFQEFLAPDDLAVRVRWYRGRWEPDRQYQEGDLVRSGRNMYLALEDPPIGKIGEPEWISFGGATAAATGPGVKYADILKWDNSYTPGDNVPALTIVNDNGWLMVSNTDTTDRAAPQTFGDIAHYGDTLPEDDTGWTSKVNETLRFLWVGTQYHLPFDYVISQVFFYIADVSGTLSYDLFMIDMTGGKNKIVPLVNNYPAQTTGWHAIPTGQIVVPANSTISIILQKTSHQSVVTGSGQWIYKDTSNPPVAGQVAHAKNAEHFYVHKLDNNAADQSALLDTVVVGSTITAGGAAWEVTGSALNGDIYDFNVSPASTFLPKDQLYVFEFLSYSTYSMPIWSVPDFYLSDPDVTGLIRKDDGGVVYDDNAYSIDIQYQKVYKSDDWDIMSASDIVAPDIDTSIAMSFSGGHVSAQRQRVPGGFLPGQNLANEFMPVPIDDRSVIDITCFNTQRNFIPTMAAYMADKQTPANQLSGKIVCLGGTNYSKNRNYTWNPMPAMASGVPSFELTDIEVAMDSKCFIKMEFDRRNPDFDIIHINTKYTNKNIEYCEMHLAAFYDKNDMAAYFQFVETQAGMGVQWRAFIS